MNLGNKNVRLTLRLTQEQFAFVTSQAKSLRKSPSDFLRFMIDYHIAERKKVYENY